MHSTTKALLDLSFNIIKALDKRKAVALVSIDFFKTFDKINRILLNFKIIYYGSYDNALCFMKSYLSDSSQFVRLCDGLSATKTICSGVPQCSVLGPLLFVIYT